MPMESVYIPMTGTPYVLSFPHSPYKMYYFGEPFFFNAETDWEAGVKELWHHTLVSVEADSPQEAYRKARRVFEDYVRKGLDSRARKRYHFNYSGPLKRL